MSRGVEGQGNWMPSRIRRVDRLADRFEAAWRSGQAARIEDYLSEVPHEGRSVLLRELLVVELQLRSVWNASRVRNVQTKRRWKNANSPRVLGVSN